MCVTKVVMSFLIASKIPSKMRPERAFYKLNFRRYATSNSRHKEYFLSRIFEFFRDIFHNICWISAVISTVAGSVPEITRARTAPTTILIFHVCFHGIVTTFVPFACVWIRPCPAGFCSIFKQLKTRSHLLPPPRPPTRRQTPRPALKSPDNRK